VPFYYIENLVSQVALQGNPWDFKPTENITDEIRNNKAKRQEWYSNPKTKHCFYSMVEPLNPNMRISKDENPPTIRNGYTADYDTMNLPAERIAEAVKLMKLKPSRIEQSLGKNWRLHFTFPRGIYTGNFEFDQYCSKRAVKWLNLNILPCFDEQAFITPTRYLCNGCNWTETGAGDLPMEDVQAFLVDCAKEFDFKPLTTDAQVPLDAVEKAIREKFPGFQWPSAFELGSQGPTFWIPESTSPMSAIVKPGGMITFSAHAVKVFYSWSDILGPAFSKKWSDDAIAKATEGIYFNGHDFYMRGISGLYEDSNKDAIMSYLKVSCRLSTKADKQTGLSQMDEAMAHIYRQNRIISAGPFAMQKPGILIRNGGRVLNTYSRKPMSPAPGKHAWGPAGTFSFSSAMFDHMLGADSKQFWHFIAWWQHFYRGAFNWEPRPGQNIFLGGIHSSGKTLTNTRYIGDSVGGFMDCGEFIKGLSPFNVHLYEVPHWTVDDETTIGSPANVQRTANVFKKIAANQSHMTHAKFQKQSMVDFAGRIGVTFNLDTNSMRIIGPQDPATLEKTMIFRCNDVAFSGFASRSYVDRKICEELPCLLAWLLEVKIPDFVLVDPRYGWAAHHDELLLDRTNQSQSIAPFKELLIESLSIYFQQNPEALEWRGTLTQIMRLLSQDPRNDHVMRGLRMDQVNRYLEQIQKEGLLHCEADSGKLKTRVWIFKRSAFEEILKEFLSQPATASAIEAGPTTTKNPFEK
jgi:hypothetical protein